MAESRGPMAVFSESEAGLIQRREAIDAADTQISDAEKALAQAKVDRNTAVEELNKYGLPVVERIHEAVTEDTDPGEYLQAVVNVYSRDRSGDEAVTRLQPLRERLQEGSTPVAIIGGNINHIVTGLSAGDIVVTPRKEHDKGFETSYGVSLALPLTSVNGYGRDGGLSSSEKWRDYPGEEPRLVTVMQRLADLKIAGSAGAVEELWEAGPPTWRSNDTFANYARNINNATGFIPAIMYGHSAVNSVLAKLASRFNNLHNSRYPKISSVMAAGITIGIDPAEFLDGYLDEQTETLRTDFAKDLISAIGLHVRGTVSAEWRVTTTTAVRTYLGIEDQAIIGAAKTGLEQSVDNIRVKNPLDKPISGLAEQRSTLAEACSKVIGVVGARYGLEIDPEQLESRMIDDKLAERIRRLQEDEARKKKFYAEHPELKLTEV